MRDENGGHAPHRKLNVPGQFVIATRLANLDRFFHKTPQHTSPVILRERRPTATAVGGEGSAYRENPTIDPGKLN